MLPHMSSFCHFRRRIRRRPVPLSLTCRARAQLENLIKAARGRKLSYYRQGYRFRGSGRNSWNKKKKTRKNKVRKRNEMETCLSCICFCHVYTLERTVERCFVYMCTFAFLSHICHSYVRSRVYWACLACLCALVYSVVCSIRVRICTRVYAHIEYYTYVCRVCVYAWSEWVGEK